MMGEWVGAQMHLIEVLDPVCLLHLGALAPPVVHTFLVPPVGHQTWDSLGSRWVPPSTGSAEGQ